MLMFAWPRNTDTALRLTPQAIDAWHSGVYRGPEGSADERQSTHVAGLTKPKTACQCDSAGTAATLALSVPLTRSREARKGRVLTDKVVLDRDDLRRTLLRIAHEIVEKNPGPAADPVGGGREAEQPRGNCSNEL